MRIQGSTAVLAALVLTVAIGFGPPADASGAAIDAHARAVLSDPSFQTELPFDDLAQRSGRRSETAGSGPDPAPGRRSETAGSEPDPAPGGRSETAGSEPDPAPVIPRGRESTRGREFTPEASGSEGGSCAVPLAGPIGGTVIQAFLWVLCGAVLLVLVVAGVDAVNRYRRRRQRVTEEPEPAPVAAKRRSISADEATALAAAGRYGEAVHLLLRWALARLEQRSGGALPESFTSREILRRSRIAAGDRPCLERLVRTVERSWFGGLPVAREEYELCVVAWERLARRRKAT